MRIAIVTECYIPEVNGVVYHIEALRKGLIEAGHDVLIVKPDFKVRRHYIKDNILYSPAVKLKNLYDYSISYPYSRTRLRLLKEWDPDIIHIHNEYSQGIFALYAGRKLDIPIVYTIHTMYYDYLHYLGVLQNLKVIKAAVNWGVLKYTDAAQAVICASSKMEDFLKLCAVKTPIYKIPNACVTSDFSKETLDPQVTQRLEAEYNIKNSDLNVCFCGRIAEEKNLSLTLQYWQQFVLEMPNSKLFIIGDGPSKKDLMSKAEDLGIAQSVVFTGTVPHGLLKYYYYLCDAYVMTSLSENHSISTIEANACGLPIVHIYDETNEDQYIEGITGFAFHDFEEFSSILKYIYDKNNNEDGEQNLKHSVIAAALADNYLSMTDKIMKVYEKAIANHKEMSHTE